MEIVDKLYVCPRCGAKHTAEEWDYTTEEEYGSNIQSLEEVDDPDCVYVCPSCKLKSDVIEIGTIK